MAKPDFGFTRHSSCKLTTDAGLLTTKGKMMAAKSTENSSDPRHHTKNIKRMLDDLIAHARKDVEKIDEPKAKVLFETTAEVLTGLKTAYEHYEEGSEPAFRGR